MANDTNKAGRGAHRATVALNAYCEACGPDAVPTLADMLADLRHYADASGVDFGSELGLSALYYEGEAV